MLETIVVLGFFALGGLIVWLNRRNGTPSVDPQAFVMINQRIEALNQDLKSTLTETTRQQQTSSYHMTSTVRDVTERLVKIEETNKQILDFSGQLENLQRILSNPKQRGILGEYYLETLLRNIFSPEQYQMQYKFADGEIVDAALFIKDKIVPIDSKFSLENYNRLVDEENPEARVQLEKLFINDLKNRIKETAKYVRPNEGTMEFAFMFIPHEAIYYDLLVNKIGSVTAETENILQKAATAYRVIIVSPTSFSAYLQTVMQGLKALKIEEEAKEIQKRVEELGRHIANFEQHFSSVGRNLDTAVNQYNLASKDFRLIDKDVLKISGQGMGFQPAVIERTQEDA